jgi:hypothetical protein
LIDINTASNPVLSELVSLPTPNENDPAISTDCAAEMPLPAWSVSVNVGRGESGKLEGNIT